MTRVLLVLLLIALGFLLSWIAIPIQRIEVVGNQRLTPEAIARLAGLYDGGPWLYAPLGAPRRVSTHPLVAGVQIRRPSPGIVQIFIKERTPLALWSDPLGFPSARRLGVVLDAAGRPLPLRHAPRRIQGPEADLEAGLQLARRYPAAREITFGPAGYSLDFGKRRVWLARSDLQAPSPPRGHVYAWGVSESP